MTITSSQCTIGLLKIMMPNQQLLLNLFLFKIKMKTVLLLRLPRLAFPLQHLTDQRATVTWTLCLPTLSNSLSRGLHQSYMNIIYLPEKPWSITKKNMRDKVKRCAGVIKIQGEWGTQTKHWRQCEPSLSQTTSSKAEVWCDSILLWTACGTQLKGRTDN